MTTYYVRTTGNDAAAGTASAAAWLTIDKAASTVAAGDTVWIGAGVYRELVTMDTAGVAGTIISYKADIDGAQTGDAGLVVVSAYDADDAAATRASCLNVNDKGFITWQDVVFEGGTGAAVVSNTANNQNFEGLTFTGCVFQASVGLQAFYLNYNVPTTPTGSGLTIDHCTFVGECAVEWDESAVAEADVKITVDHCLFLPSGANNNAELRATRTTTSTYNVGGVTVTQCSFLFGFYGVIGTYMDTATYPLAVSGCLFVGCTSGITRGSGAVGGVTSSYNTFLQCATNLSSVTASPLDRTVGASHLLGGIHDLPLRRKFGWSPFQPFEPIGMTGHNHLAIGAGLIDATSTVDLLGQVSQQGASERYYWIDGSDNAVADPNSKWTNDANAVDANPDSVAYCSTAGDEATNYLTAGGTNAETPSATPVISSVKARVRGYVASAGATETVKIYTDAFAETLATFGLTNTSNAWTGWTTLAVPSGGWTWAKLQALEFKAYRSAGINNFYLGMVQLAPTFGLTHDAGAVEGCGFGVKETTTYRSGANSMRFDGAGVYEMLIPVEAAATTISVWGQYDGAYSGDLPILEVVNIVGDTDKSDAMTGAANTWEEMTVTFTPTAAGYVRARIRSRSANPAGKTYFDDFVVT